MNKLKFWKRNKDLAPSSKTEHRSVEDAVSGDVCRWINLMNSDTAIHVGNANSAMKLAAVYRCVDILSGSIASLPLQLKIKREGVFELAQNNRLNYLLSVRANSRLTAYDLIQNSIIQMVNFGNAYILPQYTAGEPDELILLSPHTVSYEVHADKYHVNDLINGIVGVYCSHDMIHLRNMSLDGGYTGVSTIQYAGRVMSVAANADDRTLDSFNPGNMLKGFISGDRKGGVFGYGQVQDEQLKEVSERVSTELIDGKPITYLPGSIVFHPTSISSTDLQLLETRKFGVLDICRFYGLHPDKVFAGKSQNYKASQMSGQSFLSDTLQPYLRKIESEFTAKLIPRSLSDKMKIEFDVEALLLTGLEQRADYMEKTIQNDIYSPNYWRAKMGQKAVVGGDDLMMSMNVAPINSDKFKSRTQNLPPKTQDKDN